MTMALRFAALVVIVSSVIVVQVAGQYGCRPNIVTNMQLRNDILTWDKVDYETCDISYYEVEIQNVADRTEYAFQVIEQSFDATFLAPCQQYRFIVRQVSTDDLESSGRILYATTTPPPEADLSIQSLRVSKNPRWIRLDWDLLDEWKSCASHYRILVYNEDQDIPEDMYINSAGISLTYLMPCTTYTFAVTAMYNLEDEGPPSVIRQQVLSYEATAPNIIRVIPHSTSVEVTWSLEYYIRNRCLISSVNVNAAPYFAASFPIQDNPDDRRPFTVTIPGLTPDTIYNFNVTVTNSAGISPGTTVFAQTLE